MAELSEQEKANLQIIFDRITEDYKNGKLPLMVIMVNPTTEEAGYIKIDGVSEPAADAALDAFIENYV